MAKQKETINFKSELEKLDEINNKIASSSLSIDESLALYEEGLAIAKKLEKALKEAEEKVEKIIDAE